LVSGIGMDQCLPPMVKEQVRLFTVRAYGAFCESGVAIAKHRGSAEVPTMNLPGLPTLPALGTVAHDITTLEDQNNNAGLQQRINDMVERERLEDDGIGDELMEMQEIL